MLVLVLKKSGCREEDVCMDFFNEENKKALEGFIKECVESDILEVKRRIHRVWDAQEEMMNNNLSLLNRLEKGFKKESSKGLGGSKPELLDNFLTLEDSLAKLEGIVPEAYAIWIELFKNGEKEYFTDPVHNLVVKGSAWEKTFDCFLRLYLDKPGYLLDIGCGPQAVPYYLRNYPIEYIYGIDPLPPFEEHPFKFAQNIAEFIPYKDESFEYIISATSLDHVLLLDKALDEMYRVLKQDGVLLIWASTGENYIENPWEEIEGYNPYRKDIKAVDKCHMFHIGPCWFETMMGKWYKECHYSDRQNNHFYAFRKK